MLQTVIDNYHSLFYYVYIKFMALKNSFENRERY